MTHNEEELKYDSFSTLAKVYATANPRKVLNWILDKPSPASEYGLSKHVKQAKLEYYNELLVQIQNKIGGLTND